MQYTPVNSLKHTVTGHHICMFRRL